MGAGDLTDDERPVRVDVVFDRFPASVRGAIVVRALDREPHQIKLVGADVVEAEPPSRPVRSVAVDEAVVDVAPHGEVLIPFDIPFADLDRGSYRVRAEVLVDGATRISGPDDGGKRFTVRA